MVPKEMAPEDPTEFWSNRTDQSNNQSSRGMDKENSEITTAASAGGGRYPILSQILAFPGLFAGTLGAIVLTVVGAVLPRMVPAISTMSALVVAAPAIGLSLGLGIGWDGAVPHRLAQRFQPIGVALLILPPVMGLLVGQTPTPSRGSVSRGSLSRWAASPLDRECLGWVPRGLSPDPPC